MTHREMFADEGTDGPGRGDASASEAPPRLLGLAGSLRDGSYNRALIRAAGELAPREVRWSAYERLGEVPPYDQDEDTDPPPPAVAHLRESVGRSDALLIATPEYNHSIPGVLKNAVDWASRPYGESALIDRPVAVIGASPSDYGAQWAQRDLRRVLEACGSEVLDAELAVSRADERVRDGELVDGETREELREIVGALVSASRRRRAAERRDAPAEERACA